MFKIALQITDYDRNLYQLLLRGPLGIDIAFLHNKAVHLPNHLCRTIGSSWRMGQDLFLRGCNLVPQNLSGPLNWNAFIIYAVCALNRTVYVLWNLPALQYKTMELWTNMILMKTKAIIYHKIIKDIQTKSIEYTRWTLSAFLTWVPKEL